MSCNQYVTKCGSKELTIKPILFAVQQNIMTHDFIQQIKCEQTVAINADLIGKVMYRERKTLTKFTENDNIYCNVRTQNGVLV